MLLLYFKCSDFYIEQVHLAFMHQLFCIRTSTSMCGMAYEGQRMSLGFRIRVFFLTKMFGQAFPRRRDALLTFLGTLMGGKVTKAILEKWGVWGVR